MDVMPKQRFNVMTGCTAGHDAVTESHLASLRWHCSAPCWAANSGSILGIFPKAHGQKPGKLALFKDILPGARIVQECSETLL